MLKEQPLDPATRPFSGVIACHDVQVFRTRSRRIAAAACMSEGQLWDISNPASPRTVGRITRFRNSALDFWHGAAFTWDGRVVAFGDEALREDACRGRSSRVGNVWFYRVVRPGARTRLLGRYAVPRPQNGYCSIHLFNVVPTVTRRYIGVASAYSAGTTVFDFTNPARPRELAFFDPPDADTWSAYWNGSLVVANDIARGLDVFRLADARGRLPRTRAVDLRNPQTQEGR